MLKRLRLQLTFLYILVALSLVALIGFGSYSLLKFYFQRQTDLALQYKMASQFREYGFTPPPELIRAEKDWQAVNPRQSNLPDRTPEKSISTNNESEDEAGEEEGTLPGTQIPGYQVISQEEENEENYDGQLASIYTLHLDANGQILDNPIGSQPPFSQDVDASRAAVQSGHDLRTSTLNDGTRVRLLTYNLTGPNSPVVLQMGRTLIDQERVLQQYLAGLVILGSFASVLLGLGSWYLSGRSLGPAQRAWDQQQAFVSNASHELRTPLTLIKASAEVGLRNQPRGEEKGLWRDILGETDYMNHLVDDLLLLSRLDSQRLKLAREPISVKELLNEIAQQAGKLVGEKGIKIEVGNAGGVILADPIRMRQVLLILIDNSLRFTPPGGTIHLEAAAKRKMQQITISDNGSGIPQEHLPHLFERFYQANPTGEAGTRGNGLGLSIARGLVEAQGGAIHIESQAGAGTRVLLELPSASEEVSG